MERMSILDKSTFNVYTDVSSLGGNCIRMKPRNKGVRGEKYELGLKTRIDVLGKKAAESTGVRGKLFEPAHDFLTESVWASVWARTEMSWKTRLLVNVGILAAINRPRQLERYIKGAILNGCTKEEIVEVLLQVGAYCGAPALVEGCRIAEKAFQEE
jgi:4-carboxymuconolactone decarboxylase